MSEKILSNIPSPSESDPASRQGGLEGRVQPTDTTVGRSDPIGNSVPPVAPHKKFPILSVIILIVLSVTSVFSIYLLIQVRQLSMSQPLPSPSPSPVASADPKANWQQYTNSLYGISLRYPPDLTINTVNDPANPRSHNLLSLTTEDNSKYLSLQDFKLIIHKNQSISQLRSKTMQSYSFNDINGLKDEYAYNIGDSNSPRMYSLRILANKDKDVYEFNANFSNPPSQVDKTTINQIISTFKFTTSKNSFTCPKSGYADCMPSLDGTKPSCTKEALDWYKANCPDFQGAAL